VTALVRAELLKVRSTRIPAGLLLATMVFTALTVWVNVPRVGAADLPIGLDNPDLLATVVGGAAFGAPLILIVLLGVLSFTQEFRYGTATTTYLNEPHRVRILVAKLLTIAILSVVVTTVSLALSLIFAIALIRSRDGDVTVAAQFWQTLAAGSVVMAAYGAIGVALGALVRNQIVAVAGVLFWMMLVEQVLIPELPALGRWLPFGAMSALLQLDEAWGLGGELLSAAAGGLVFAGYTVAAVVLAVVVTPKRDVL
jgi:ABC-type transport system involved in multi-copper enzyme maturation permease subunit